MNVSIIALAKQALSSLFEQHGMSKKEVWMYKQYGFKPILQYFEKKGIANYSQLEMDRFMIAVRRDFEKGDLMKWKWARIRKASVFLASLYADGALDVAPRIPWAVEYNPLHQKPSEEQFNDADNLFALVYLTKMEMQKFQVTPDVLKTYVY